MITRIAYTESFHFPLEQKHKKKKGHNLEHGNGTCSQVQLASICADSRSSLKAFFASWKRKKT